MSISQKDIKLLWGRAANRCAICRTPVSEDRLVATAAFPYGEQAHIVAVESTGPRGLSVLTAIERDSYPNLILLCPTHHAIVDRAVKDYPVEKLYMIKTEHELWVERSLTGIATLQNTANQQILANVVDAAVVLCHFEDWETWTSWALSCDPEWTKELYDSVREFPRKLKTVLWPACSGELRAAALHLAIQMQTALDEFLEFGIPENDRWVTDRYYRRAQSPDLYNLTSERFQRQLRSSHAAVFEATKAANWFASIVRRDINPMFMAERGRFTASDGSSLGPIEEFNAARFEYSPAEIDSLLEKFKAG